MNGAQLAKVRPGLQVAEEALALVRRAPWDTLAVYYIGSLPFVAGLLGFWSLMSAGRGAQALLPAAALVAALLFIWMKVWQARYSQELMALVREVPA